MEEREVQGADPSDRKQDGGAGAGMSLGNRHSEDDLLRANVMEIKHQQTVHCRMAEMVHFGRFPFNFKD